MLDFLEMWKKPKMIAYVIITAALYALLVLPFMQFKIFGGHGDFGRLGVGVVTAFSFLFGPAAAWGAAIGNTVRDAATSGLDSVTIFGFVANFLLGYIPYKLWNTITKMKPDLRSIKKIGLFVGVCLAASAVCGVVIGWALYWLNPPVPFMPTSLIIAVSDAVWAIVLGSVVLALSYKPLGKRGLLYSDMLCTDGKKHNWTKGRTIGLFVFVACIVISFALGALLPAVDPFVLLVPALVSMVALIYAMR